MTILEVVMTIVVAIVSAGGFWALLENELKSSRRQREEKIEILTEEIKQIHYKLDETTELCKSFSRDRLNYLCEQYMDLGYIPKNDIISFKLLGEAYEHSDGNTEVRTKFEYVIKNLEVK